MFKEHFVIYLLVIIIFVIGSLLFPHPSDNKILAALLISVIMLLVLTGYRYQASLISKRLNKLIKPYRLVFNIIINFVSIYGIMAFTLYLVGHLISNNKSLSPSIQPIPSDYWYLLALLIFWLLFIKEIFSREGQWELTAMAATCIPFLEQDHKIKTIMIYNTNFQQWMFPGGHVKIDRGEFPEEVAIRKATSEAGIEVNLMRCFDSITEYSHCQQKNAPFFIYHLFIDEQARCRKNDGHEFHIDFTYIGKVIDLKERGIFDRIVIDIEPQCNDASTIRQCILNSLKNKYISEKKLLPKQLYPEDIPDRLLVALDAYKIITRPK